MANERRLIDANELKRRIIAFATGCHSEVLTVDSIIMLLNQSDTVEAVEVVHGRWIWNEENECWVCSNCEMSALNNYRGNSTDSNYGPNCGAKMDEHLSYDK